MYDRNRTGSKNDQCIWSLLSQYTGRCFLDASFLQQEAGAFDWAGEEHHRRWSAETSKPYLRWAQTIWRTTATWEGMERLDWAWIITGAQGGSSQEQASCSDRGLRRLGFQAFSQSQVLVWTPHRWLANAISICKKQKNEATNQNSRKFGWIKMNLDEFSQNLDEFGWIWNELRQSWDEFRQNWDEFRQNIDEFGQNVDRI